MNARVTPIPSESTAREHEALRDLELPTERIEASGEMHTLISCEDEPIHFCEGIQDHGYLFAFDTLTGRLHTLSANTLEILKDPETGGSQRTGGSSKHTPGSTLAGSEQGHLTSLLNTSFYDLLEDDDHAGRQRIQIQQLSREVGQGNARAPIRIRLAASCLIGGRGAQFDAVLYQTGSQTVLELEELAATDHQSPSLQRAHNLAVASRLPDLKAFDSIESLLDCMVKIIREVTGYDRVMMYQFNKDWHGKVVAESRRDDLEPYLGLNYPATDIPAQARALYRKNLIRMIRDIESEPVPLLPRIPLRRAGIESGRVGDNSADSAHTQQAFRSKPLDLSNSMIRSVSPFHIQYLRNMGVGATMSISILINGELWGLIACHHYSPKYIEQSLRLECETLSQFFGWQIQTKEQQLELRKRRATDALIDQIMFELTSDNHALGSMHSLEQPLLSLLDACGFTLFLGAEAHELGKVLPTETGSKLAESFIASSPAQVHATSRLHEDFEFIDEAEAKGIAGALFIPLSPVHGYFAIWYRPEKSQTINWAGAPQVKGMGDENRLSPRGSFALWRETVRGRSLDWSETDIQTAERFNRLFVAQVIDRKIDVEANLHRLQELDRAKDQFLASISHELRTPLNVIVGWTDLALTTPEDSRQMVEALEVIRKNATTQAELINDLLDISRIVSGTLKLQVKNLSLRDVINEVGESFRTALQAKSLELQLSMAKGEQAILGDPVRIKQIFTNLVNNAIKFTPKGGRIGVSIRQSHSNYLIEVSDTGKGIEPENLLRIFERFTQLHDSHGRTGMGLGLSIVKSLVDMHGGDIQASSEGKNRGSSFRVSLPISPVAVSDDVAASFSSRTIADCDSPSASRGRLHDMRILAVEDEEDAARFLARLLSSQGAQVTSVSNGVEAMAELRDSDARFDLLLSDIGMPEMDGYELIEAVRTSQEHSSMKAIALTAYAFSGDRVKALKAGYDSYVTKPVDLEELYIVIETTCLRSQV